MKDTLLYDSTKRSDDLEMICRMTMKELIQYIIALFPQDAFTHGGQGDSEWLYHRGTVPILLTAHLDTVHKQPVKTVVYSNGRMSSPEGIGGDDRCGVYMILKLLQSYDCHVLFCCGEETGFKGSYEWSRTWDKTSPEVADVKYIIELDRRGTNDAVYYDCDNPAFSDFIEQEYWTLDYGSGSDISVIAPTLGIAAVNLSCGYFDEHQTKESIDLKVVENNILEIGKLIQRSLADDVPQYEYIRKPKYCHYDYDNYTGYSWHDKYYQPMLDADELTLTAKSFSEQDGRHWLSSHGMTKAECIANLFLEHPSLCLNDITDYEWS